MVGNLSSEAPAYGASRVADGLGHSVDSRDDGLERGVDDVCVHAHSPYDHAVLSLTDLALHIRCGERITTSRQRVFCVVEHAYVVTERGNGVDERRYWTIPFASDRLA